MLAAKHDTVIEQGATWELDIDWYDDAGALVDLTSLDFRVKMRPTKESTTVLAAGSYDGGTNTPSGDIVIAESGVGGRISLSLTDTLTTALDFTQGVWDLEAEDSTPTVWRLIEGKVTLSKEVTYT